MYVGDKAIMIMGCLGFKVDEEVKILQVHKNGYFVSNGKVSKLVPTHSVALKER